MVSMAGPFAVPEISLTEVGLPIQVHDLKKANRPLLLWT